MTERINKMIKIYSLFIQNDNAGTYNKSLGTNETVK
jgi:hypothetical protein